MMKDYTQDLLVFSKVAFKFKSDIKVYKNGNKDKVYNPKSILSVLSMGGVKEINY